MRLLTLMRELLGEPLDLDARHVWGRYAGPWAMTYTYPSSSIDGVARVGVQFDGWTRLDGGSVSAGLHWGAEDGVGVVVGWKPLPWHRLVGLGLSFGRVEQWHVSVGTQGAGAPVVDLGRVNVTRERDGAHATGQAVAVRLWPDAGPALFVARLSTGSPLLARLPRSPRFLFAPRRNHVPARPAAPFDWQGLFDADPEALHDAESCTLHDCSCTCVLCASKLCQQ